MFLLMSGSDEDGQQPIFMIIIFLGITVLGLFFILSAVIYFYIRFLLYAELISSLTT